MATTDWSEEEYLNPQHTFSKSSIIIRTPQQMVNSRLFERSLLLNPLRDRVTIVHRPGRFNNNIDPLSRYPVPAYYVTLAHVTEQCQQKLWDGYLSDPFCR